jgi:pimeloyl-ACP methyl ester carboxylesterase
MHEGKFRLGDLEFFYRQTGSGKPVLLLHCAGGTNSQWRKLMNSMSDRYRLTAIDLLSHGQSDKMPEGTTDEFDLEIETISASVDLTGTPLHHVGHSAVGRAAPGFAVRYPDKVKSLVLFEPALFGMLAKGADQEGWNDYVRLCIGMIDHFDAGDETGAAETMVDYWSAPGTFQTLPPERRAHVTYGIRAAIEKARKFLAYPGENAIDPTQIQVPTLVLSGETSPRSARGVSDILARGIKDVRFHRIVDAGHMAPLSHARQVNVIIEDYIRAHTD